MYFVLMPNPHPRTDQLRQNQNYTGPTSDVGKFRTSLNSWKGRDSSPTNKYMHRIPEEVRNLYSWFKGLTKDDREFLFELKGIYEVLKGNLQNSKFTEKVMSGEQLSRTELEQIKLMIDALEKAHKMKYGEKKINIHADLKDIRDAMFDDN